MRNDFAVFILSHGRPHKVKTLEILSKCNYTGKWYIICDNEDNTLPDYFKNFGEEHIIVFDKLAKSKECDTFDNLDKRNTVLFARNSCHEIAKKLGLTYFLELDDDYNAFRSRFWDGTKLSSITVGDMNSIIDEMLEFLEVSGAHSVAFSQSGDYITGANSKIYKEKIIRKAMNAFFCKTDRPFKFVGRMNDDVNTYVSLGSKGYLFFTVADIVLNQEQTQKSSGGLTEMYLELGTYVKSFSTVLCNPASVYIAEMGCNHRRIHHYVDWKYTVPEIISYRFKKEV